LKTYHLTESEQDQAAIIFGRFNPPHFGHKAAWDIAAGFPIWYVGTNQSTQGPKDPLPFDIKMEAMKTFMPELEDHLVAEQSWFTLASMVYKQHGAVTLHIVTDANDAKIFVPALQKQNGLEGPHGFYKFNDIVWSEAERKSEASKVRQAIKDNNPQDFETYSGVSVNTEVAGHPYFNLVRHYMMPYMQAEMDKEKQKAEREKQKAEKEQQKAEKAAMKQNKTKGPAQELAESNLKELSTELLGKYKKAAGADAKKADAEGDYARGDKRFKGINKATNKQFDNDLKKHGQQSVVKGKIDEGVNDPHIFKCILLFGPMGAGKSTIARPLLTHTGLRSVNLDNFNEMFIKKGEVPTGHLAPDQLEKSWQLSQTQQGNFIDGRLGIIVDGSGRNPDTAIGVIEKLQPLGYEFMMIFVNVSEATSIARQQSRADKQQQQWGVGRQVDATLAKDTYSQVQKNLEKYSAYFGPKHFVYVDNENTPDLSQATKKVDAFLRESTTQPEALEWIKTQKGGEQVAQKQRKLATAQDSQNNALKQYNPLNPKFWKTDSQGKKQFTDPSQQDIAEVKQRLDPKCWKGKHKEGTKIKGGIRVNNCVPNEGRASIGYVLEEIWQQRFNK